MADQIISPSGVVLSPAAPAGDLSTSAHLAGGASLGRLGPFLAPDNRARASATNGLRHDIDLVAPDLPALLLQYAHGEFRKRDASTVIDLSTAIVQSV